MLLLNDVCSQETVWFVTGFSRRICGISICVMFLCMYVSAYCKAQGVTFRENFNNIPTERNKDFVVGLANVSLSCR